MLTHVPCRYYSSYAVHKYVLTPALCYFDWFIDLLIDWLIDWFLLINWFIDWLIDWFHAVFSIMITAVIPPTKFLGSLVLSSTSPATDCFLTRASCLNGQFHNFSSFSQATNFLWSFEKVYHKQEVCFLYFLGQMVSWQYNTNLLDQNWPCTVINDHDWQLWNCPLDFGIVSYQASRRKCSVPVGHGVIL